MILLSHSEDATLALGSLLAKHLSFGQVVTLHGDLGAGKTVFSRGVARGLGVTEPVTSPTFTVVQEYRLADHKMFFHLDLYRIDNEQAALAFGIEDFLFANDAITLVEWPERIPKLLPVPPVLPLRLEHADHDLRQITIPDELASKLHDTPLPDGITLLPLTQTSAQPE